MIEVTIDDRAVREALTRLQNAGGRLRPALLDIGETLIESTKQRFVSQTSPDGVPWARNTAVTIAHKNRDQPLTDQGNLGDEINYQLIGETAVQIGSSKEYAATQQFGAAQGEFGVSRRGGPIPWGDIPARPFLGLSIADETEILAGIALLIRDAL